MIRLVWLAQFPAVGYLWADAVEHHSVTRAIAASVLVVTSAILYGKMLDDR